ncbi:MAG: MATE family efflux transporter [Oscillospiraceae bacterium]|nr:MATE family efflux transporter [Oscillospiraceae bacterium]
MVESQKKAVRKGDLTEGGIVSKLTLFALPLIAGNIVNQLYNVADSVVVGNFVGSDALAAVGVCFSVMMCFNALFFGLSMGAGILIAQCFGAKRQKQLQDAINTSFTLTLILGATITVLGVLLSRGLLGLMQTPANIMDDSATYLSIIFFATIGNLIYNMGSGILRGMGDSRWPLIFLIFCSVMNVLLDLIFVIFLDMGVAGVAWATLLSQCASAVLVLLRIHFGGYAARIQFNHLGIQKDSLMHILRLGLPSGIQEMTFSVGMMVVQSFANGFGSNFIAANSIIMKVDGFAVMPMMGLGSAIATFVGQNMGAGKLERTRKGIRAATVMVTGLGLLMGILFLAFGHYLIRAFTSNAPVIEMAMKGLQFLAFVYTIMGIGSVVSGAMRGAGASIAPMVTSLCGLLIRIPVAYFAAVLPRNYMGLFVAMASAMAVNCILISIYYFKGNWRSKTVVHAEPQIE